MPPPPPLPRTPPLPPLRRRIGRSGRRRHHAERLSLPRHQPEQQAAHPEAALTLTGPDGFYVSAWSAKTDWGGNNPSFEWDIYGGKHFDLDGTDLNVEAYEYAYPDANVFGGAAASYFEGIFS